MEPILTFPQVYLLMEKFAGRTYFYLNRMVLMATPSQRRENATRRCAEWQEENKRRRTNEPYNI
jgi:hypothetical protein